LPREFGVVGDGLLRLFYLRDDGRELNKSFLASGDFVGAVDALLSGQPTRMWLETIEHSVIWFAEYHVLTDLYACHAGWERLGRRFAEMLYLKKIAREAAFLMDSAAERYHAFLRDYPEIESRIPDYHIAGYLGITAESLSRLKKARVRTGAGRV
jgi:CRP-like cAMP-binding protein